MVRIWSDQLRLEDYCRRLLQKYFRWAHIWTSAYSNLLVVSLRNTIVRARIKYGKGAESRLGLPRRARGAVQPFITQADTLCPVPGVLAWAPEHLC